MDSSASAHLDSIEARVLAAEAAFQADRIHEAQSLCVQILRENPTNIASKLLLGRIAVGNGRNDEGYRLFLDIIEIEPNHAGALQCLSVLMRETDRIPESIDFCKRAIEAAPLDPDCYNNLGLSLLRAGLAADAAGWFAQAIELNPNLAALHHNFGVALQQEGKFVEACESYERALPLSPTAAKTLIAIGRLKIAMRRTDEAEAYIRRAIDLQPDNTALLPVMADVVADLGRTEEAEALLRKAVGREPNNAEAQTALGIALQQLGHFKEAGEALTRAITLNPAQATAYYALVQGKRVTESDRPHLKGMEMLLHSGNLNISDLAGLNYGLGKSFEDLHDYRKAIRHFDAANRFSRQHHSEKLTLDRDSERAKIDETIGTFTKGFLEAHANLGSSVQKPLFVVGMMRSGTTLTEQILASHPSVRAGGELMFWQRRLSDSLQKGTASTLGELPQLAEEYLALLESISPGKRLVCDKNPHNYHVLGWIHLAFPDARIIHCRRHPVDTCLSIYTTAFRWPQPFLFDRGNIAFWYKQYLRLMEHWRQVLPADRLFEVNYEELVSDREGVTREMIEFVCLEWNDACLSPEKNGGTVKTASVWQARQPVYSSSVDRWRKYEPWLGEFGELLPAQAESGC